MKHTLWSDPNKKWDGFQPVPYFMNDKALDLPLAQSRSEDGEDAPADDNAVPTTVGEILKTLLGRQVEVESGMDTEITVGGTEKLFVTGLDFNRKILEVLLSFRQDGMDENFAEWFWYGSNWNKHNPANPTVFSSSTRIKSSETE